MNQSVILYSASSLLILTGLGAPFLSSHTWFHPVGSVLAAFGGALLTIALSSNRDRERAKEILEPDLQAAARHLSDTVTKLSRVAREYEGDNIDAEVAIDRMQQLITTFYSSLHDVNVLAGSPSSFESLVDIVSTCEKTAGDAYNTMASGSGTEEEKAEKLQLLQGQLEATRLQLGLAKREFSPTEVNKKQELVGCPGCGATKRVEISAKPGPGITVNCSNCGSRYHAFRQEAGHVKIVPWGDKGGTSRVEAECPSCNLGVPANIKDDEISTNRFCLNCCTLVEMDRNGSVVNSTSSTPAEAELAGFRGRLPYLQCPECDRVSRALWQGNGLARAVCIPCQHVLEIPLNPEDQKSEQDVDPNA